METQVAPLYVTLLAEIAKLPESSVYDFWPKYPQETAKSDGATAELGKLLKASFWNRILDLDCQYKVFPVHNSDTTRTLEATTAKMACFDLGSLASTPEILVGLLPRMQLKGRKMVNPIGDACSGLVKALQKAGESNSLCTVSPEFVADLFRDDRNCEILWEEWGRTHNSEIEVISELLEFILADGVQTDILLGCAILPLADNSRGIFKRKGGDGFVVPPAINSSLAKKLVDLVPQLVVAPLGDLIFRKLTSGGLNVSDFSLNGVPRVLAAMGDQSAKRRLEFFIEIWRDYNHLVRLQPEEAAKAYRILVGLPIIVATKLGDASEYDFYSLRDFHQYRHTAMLEDSLDRSRGRPILHYELRQAKEILRSFAAAGLYQVDARTFPESELERESLGTCTGLYRLLRCIEALAARGGSTIEAFITARSIDNPNYLGVSDSSIVYMATLHSA